MYDKGVYACLSFGRVLGKVFCQRYIMYSVVRGNCPSRIEMSWCTCSTSHVYVHWLLVMVPLSMRSYLVVILLSCYLKAYNYHLFYCSYLPLTKHNCCLSRAGYTLS